MHLKWELQKYIKSLHLGWFNLSHIYIYLSTMSKLFSPTSTITFPSVLKVWYNHIKTDDYNLGLYGQNKWLQTYPSSSSMWTVGIFANSFYQLTLQLYDFSKSLLPYIPSASEINKEKYIYNPMYVPLWMIPYKKYFYELWFKTYKTKLEKAYQTHFEVDSNEKTLENYSYQVFNRQILCLKHEECKALEFKSDHFDNHFYANLTKKVHKNLKIVFTQWLESNKLSFSPHSLVMFNLQPHLAFQLVFKDNFDDKFFKTLDVKLITFEEVMSVVKSLNLEHIKQSTTPRAYVTYNRGDMIFREEQV